MSLDVVWIGIIGAWRPLSAPLSSEMRVEAGDLARDR